MADVNGGMAGETSSLESSAGEEYTAQSDVLAVVERLEETQSSSFLSSNCNRKGLEPKRINSRPHPRKTRETRRGKTRIQRVHSRESGTRVQHYFVPRRGASARAQP
jgi:hypothetical protein